jgi:hypothetical protein
MLKVEDKDVSNLRYVRMNSPKNRGNNISKKYNYQWIAPERTGSRKVSEILTYYDFKCTNKPLNEFGYYNYNHAIEPNEEGTDYKVICNARNPYGRVYALFKNFYHPIKDKSKEGFRKYLTEDLPRGQTMKMVVEPKWDKPFDYVIRLEHMKDDLMKLPFILDVLTESQVEMLSSHGKEIESWEEFYDDDMKEIVYEYTKHQFKLWGYEK